MAWAGWDHWDLWDYHLIGDELSFSARQRPLPVLATAIKYSIGDYLTTCSCSLGIGME